MLSTLIIRRPVLLICVLYAAGVWAADLHVIPLAPLLGSALALATACLIAWQGRVYLLGLVLVLAGAANFTLHTAVLSPNDLRRLIGEGTQDVSLRGTLCQAPVVKAYEQNGDTTWRTVGELEVRELRIRADGTTWQPALGKVAVSSVGVLPPGFFAGQKVELAGRLRLPNEPVAEGLFDYRNFLRRRGIYYQLQVTSTNGWQLAPEELGRKPPLAERFISWGKAALARGLPGEDESLRLEWALTLGWKTALTDEVSEPFIRASTYHIFAVDGLRIAIISGIFLALFRASRLPRVWAGLLIWLSFCQVYGSLLRRVFCFSETLHPGERNGVEREPARSGESSIPRTRFVCL